MANSCQCTAGAAGSLGAVGDAHEDGRAGQHQPGLVPQPQPGAAWAGLGFGPGHSLTLWGASPLSNQHNQTLHGHAGVELPQDPYNNKGLYKLPHPTSWMMHLSQRLKKSSLSSLTAPRMLVVLSQNNTLHIRSKKTLKTEISGKGKRYTCNHYSGTILVYARSP